TTLFRSVREVLQVQDLGILGSPGSVLKADAISSFCLVPKKKLLRPNSTLQASRFSSFRLSWNITQLGCSGMGMGSSPFINKSLMNSPNLFVGVCCLRITSQGVSNFKITNFPRATSVWSAFGSVTSTPLSATSLAD